MRTFAYIGKSAAGLAVTLELVSGARPFAIGWSPAKLLVDSFRRKIPLHQLHESLLWANVLLLELGKLLFVKNCGGYRQETKEAPCVKTPILVLGTAIHNSYGS